MFIIVSLSFQSCLLFGKKKMAGIDEPTNKRGSEFPASPSALRRGIKGDRNWRTSGNKNEIWRKKTLRGPFHSLSPVRKKAYQPAGQQQQHVLCGGAWGWENKTRCVPVCVSAVEECVSCRENTKTRKEYVQFHFIFFLEKGEKRRRVRCALLLVWAWRFPFAALSALLPSPSSNQRKGEESWQGKDKICSLLSPSQEHQSTPGLKL